MLTNGHFLDTSRRDLYKYVKNLTKKFESQEFWNFTGQNVKSHFLSRSEIWNICR